MRIRAMALIAGLLVLALALPVSGCARKPSNLLPPEGSDGENFPRTFPSS